MNTLSNGTAYPNHGGNALSDQPAQVREQFLANLPSRSSSRAQYQGTEGTARSSDTRGLDPVLMSAFNLFIDAIASMVNRRSEVMPRAMERGEMKRDHVMGPGHVEYFPTWSFWGRTFVRMRNTGSVPTVVSINEDRFHLNPEEETVKDGLWAAFPIRVVNSSELPGSQVTVRVW